MGKSHAGHDVSQHMRNRTRGGDTLLFARNFFRHPRMLGSIIPSSRFLVRQLLRPIEWASAEVIVEYGPGIGVITKEILRRMRPDAVLITIETNRDFVRFLAESVPDPRLRVVEDSAVAVDEILHRFGYEKANYIISGIPFSTLDASLREQILRKTSAVLQTGGAFLVFQFSTRVLPDLRRVFHYVKRSFQPLNVLPAHLFICEPARA